MNILTPQQIARAAQAYAPKAEPRFSAADDAFEQAVKDSLQAPRTVILDRAGKVTLEGPDREGSRQRQAGGRQDAAHPSAGRLTPTGTGVAAGGYSLNLLV